MAANLERYLDFLSLRQRLSASNIANIDTPGYRTLDVDFRRELFDAAGSLPAASAAEGLAMKPDGNNVSLDREAKLLAENALRFAMAANLLRGQVRLVRAAIQGGKIQ